MRLGFASPLMVLVVGLLGGSACSADHTLYYLDTTRNVCRVQIASKGHTVGKSERLTTLGGYDDYCVSPDGKQVAGIKNTAKSDEGLYEGVYYLETRGKQPVRNVFHGAVASDGVPSTWWSPKMNYLFAYGGTVGGTTRVYSLKAGRVVYVTPNEEIFGPVTVDERYALVHEDTGDGDGPADQWVLDLSTGKLTKVMKIWSRFDGENYVWIGRTHQCAVIGSDRNVWVESVKPSGDKPHVTKYRLTQGGGCTDLRYIEGKGLYFARRIKGGKSTGYYCKDLRTVHAGRLLAVEDLSGYEESDIKLPKSAVSEQTSVTKDGTLAACVVMLRGGKTEIQVFNKAGKSFPAATGTKPQWKDSR